MAYSREEYRLIKLGLMEKTTGPKPKKPIAKKSAKKIAEEKSEETAGKKEAQWKFFEDARKEMTGKCILCGGQTERDNDLMFHFSVAHILPKNKKAFPSVATHPYNKIELCYHGNSCHTNYDSYQIELVDIKENFPKAWEEIVSKFLKFYPSIDPDERHRIPYILMDYVPINNQQI